MSEATGDLLDRFCVGDDPEFLRRDAAELLPQIARSVRVACLRPGYGAATMPPAATETIDRALDEFLAEQRERLSERTFGNYERVIELLRRSLNGYGPNALEASEHARWEHAYEAGDEEAFCHLLGPEKVPEHLGEFLGYFMVRKVIAGHELLKASGTVTGKLVRWLEAHELIGKEAAADAAERAQGAARDLPAAERLGQLLYDVTEPAPELDVEKLPDEDWVEDYLAITAVKPGRIWFERGVGPIEVPQAASDLARPGWELFLAAVRLGRRWRLLETGPVYP